MKPAIQPADTEYCPNCQKFKSADDFQVRPVKSGGGYVRETFCRVCVKERKAFRNFYLRGKLNAKALRDKIRQLDQETNKQRVNVPAVNEMVAELIEQYGGVKQFCALWKADTDAVRKSGKNQAVLMRNYAAQARLVVLANQMEQGGDTSDMTDEELDEEIVNMVIARLGPQLAELPEEDGPAEEVQG